METTNCWKCGTPASASLFCRFCDSLLPPTLDYYSFMGLDQRLHLDAGQLQKRFYDLSRLLHPDKYMRRTPKERQYSLEATAILNDAFRVLRDPVSRAEYVLKQNGFNIGEQRSGNVPPELLEEVFELNLALEELRGGDQSMRPQLDEARRRFRSMRDEIDIEMEELFNKFDQTKDRAVLADIRHLLNRRRYIWNLTNEVEKDLA